MKITPITLRGAKRWRVNYTHLGQQKRRFCTTSKEANDFVDSLNKQNANEGPTLGSIQGQERVEMLAHWLKMKELGVSPHEMLKAALKAQTNTPIVPVVVEACLAAKTSGGCRARYVRQLAHVLGHFGAIFPNVKIGDVAPGDLETFIRGGGSYASATLRGRTADMRTLFAFAFRKGWVTENPCERLEPIKLAMDPPGVLRPKAAAKLMRVALRKDRKLIPYLALGLFCGIRPEEIRKLTWDNVKLARGFVEVGAGVAKTSTRRLVKIPENAKQWLAMGGDLPPRGMDGKHGRLSKVRRAAGLFAARSMRLNGVKFESAGWPHDAMRHSAASYLLAKTEDAAATALQMGHSVKILQSNYMSLVTKEEALEYFAITPFKVVAEVPERATMGACRSQ